MTKAHASGKGKEKIVVTSALPYANGSIHLGHLVEYIQTDIFVRFLKLAGKDAIYCCADDTHGTPIQVNAKKLGITPEELIAKFYKEHTKDFKDFLIHFDSYYTTNSPENKELADHFFTKMKENEFIYQKEIEQMYDPEAKQFLPDRFVKGTCPKCGAEDQYGDVCEKCNSTYDATELVNPKSSITGKTPILKKSTHYFFRLTAFSDRLEQWLNDNKKLQPEIRNSVLNWVKTGLKDWCISRDAPYFGFTIKGETDKYYYVWLDAPIGYISSTKHYCTTHHKNYEDYWKSEEGRVIHIIGKDIIYFHYLFWPAMLMAAEFNLPEYLVVHGFLTVNKEKMSKSRGTFLLARDYLELLEPEYLRFYYAANLSRKMSDIDLDLEDFVKRSNTELVANISNFCYRVISFINKNFEGKTNAFEDKALEKEVLEKVENIKRLYEELEFREAVKEILEISSIGNKYFQEHEPWKLVKEDTKKAQDVCTVCANICKILAICLKPIVPKSAALLEEQLRVKELTFDNVSFDMHNKRFGKEKILFSKLEQEHVNKLIKKTEEAKEEKKVFPLLLKVGEVLEIKDHPNAEKLYVLKVKTDREIQLVAGLREHLKKEDIIGKKIVVVSNLEHAKLRGEASEGMLLTGEKDGKVKLLDAKDAVPGTVISVDGYEHSSKTLSFKEFLTVKLENKGKHIYFDGSPLKAGKTGISVDIKDGAEIR